MHKYSMFMGSFLMNNIFKVASLTELLVKNLPANAADVKRYTFHLWAWKNP